MSDGIPLQRSVAGGARRTADRPHDPARAHEPTAAALPATALPRVWVVSELYWPEQTSTGYFLTRIAESLADRYDVRAVCSQPTYSSRGVRAPRREERNGVRVHRCRSTSLDKDVLPFRALNMATFTAAVFWRILRGARRGDVVLVVTNPPLMPYAVTLAARLRGARVVLLIHDLFPEVIVAAGMARPDSAVVRAVHAASRWLYRAVDRVVVLGRDMAAIVGAKAQRPDDVLTIIPNWGDTEGVRPSSELRRETRRALGLEDRFVIQFMGNMGRSHAMEALVDAAVALRDDPRVHFQFIGWGAKRAWLEEAVRTHALDNVSLLPNCPEDELPGLLNAADVGIIAFRPGMAGVSVPSRMYNVMAAGRPILAVADPHSELARVVLEEDIGWVVPADAPERLPDAIRAALGDRDIEARGERARAAAERHYSLDAVAASWRALFRGLERDAS